jgi:hypothetical protein
MIETETQMRPRFAARAAAAGLAAAAVVAAWLATGVHVSEVLRFVGYELAFVLAPGVIIHAALATRREPSLLERVVVGYALGLAFEIAMFTLNAALDARDLFPFLVLPVYAGGAVAVATGRWRLSWPESSDPTRASWLASGLVVTTVVWLTFGFFISNPLARSVDGVVYDQDLVWHLALAAESKNRWPAMDPDIAGEPFHYHTFTYRDMAAVSQVTGVPLDVVLFRLFPVAVLLGLGGGVALVTRRLGGSPSTAVLAVALALLAGELDVDTERELVFANGALLVHMQSPSFFLGAVFLMPLLFVLLELLGSGEELEDRGARPDWRLLAMLAALMAAVAGTKVNVIPGLLLGLLAFGAVDFALRRRWRRSLAAAVVVGVAIFAAMYFLLYRGGGNSREFELHPLHFIDFVAPTLSNAVAALLTVPALVVILLPLAGIAGLVAVRGWRLPSAELLLLCMFLPGLVLYLFVAQPGGPEVYFFLYGFLAAVPVSAVGMAAVWERAGFDRGDTRRAVLAGCAVVVATAAAVLVVRARDPTTPFAALMAAWVLVALVIAVAFAVGRGSANRGAVVVGVAVPLLFLLAFVDYPLDTAKRLGSRWRHGAPAWYEPVPHQQSGITRDLRSGLLWLRANSPKTAVVAVNNMFVSPGFPRYFYYAAFSERRTYIEGWDYSERGLRTQRGEPLPEDLQDRVRASYAAAIGYPAGLRALQERRVDYLVVDKLQGQYADPAAVEKFVKPVFDNDAVAIYKL